MLGRLGINCWRGWRRFSTTSVSSVSSASPFSEEKSPFSSEKRKAASGLKGRVCVVVGSQWGDEGKGKLVRWEEMFTVWHEKI